MVLEASEPVAYVTSRPDPLTVLVDLRNATAAGVSNRVATSPAGPAETVLIRESGIAEPAHVTRLAAAGVDGILVGEGLLRHADVGAALRRLISAA